VGVDAFFVISGYLITSLLVRELTDTGRIDFTRFYARRVRRLLPALALVLAVTLAAGMVMLSPALHEVQDLARGAIATLLLVANVDYGMRASEYFAVTEDFRPLLHTWSLSVEEQFYLAWPLLLVAAWRWRGGGPKRVRALVAILCLGSLALCAGLAGWSAWAFYATPARAWELGAGALLAMHVGVPESAGKAARWGGTVGLLVILASVAGTRAGASFPFPGALPAVLATVLVIWANGRCRDSGSARLLRSAPLVLVGRASYGWYLWHWPMLAIARIHQLGNLEPWVAVAIAAASLLIALVSLHWFEDPIRFDWKPASSPWRVLAVGSATTAVLLALAAGAGLWARNAPRADKEREVAFAKVDSSPDRKSCLREGRNYRPGGLPVVCTRAGDAGFVVLFGDSHADQWSSLILDWADRRTDSGYERRTLASCPPLPGIEPKYVEGVVNHACRAHNQEVFDGIQSRLDRGLPVGVVLAARWPSYLGRENLSINERQRLFIDQGVDSADAAADLMTSRLKSSLDWFSQRGVRVLLLLAPPELRYPAPECLYRRDDARCAVDRSEQERFRLPVNEGLLRVAAKYPNVRVYDPFTRFCDQERCLARVDGITAYNDEDHVSASMARSVLDELAPMLDWLSGRESPVVAGQPTVVPAASAPGGARTR